MKKLIVILFICTVFSSYANNLRLTFPNGKEILIGGTDTTITWEGVPFDAEVKLEYTVDNGVNWELITDKATGLKYQWKNIPLKKSDVCLIRASYQDTVQCLDLEWDRTYGGSDLDWIGDVLPVSDGYIVCGLASSKDGDLSDNYHPFIGINWNGKVDETGNLVYDKSNDKLNFGFYNSVIKTKDGHLIFGGRGDDYTSHRDFGYLVKYNSSGDVIWETKIKDDERELEIEKIIENENNNIVVVGGANWPYDKKVSNFANGFAAEIDANNGKVLWFKFYDAYDYNNAINSIIQTDDGAYIIVGRCHNEQEPADSSNVRFSKIDNKGDIIWDKILEGSDWDIAKEICRMPNGSYSITGLTSSNDGDFSGNKGDGDVLVFNINENDGSINWQKNYGGSGFEFGRDILIVNDKRLFVVGCTSSSDGDVKNPLGARDGWIIELSQEGELKNEVCLGGDHIERLFAICESNDKNLIVAGAKQDYTKAISTYDFDFWIAKLRLKKFVSETDNSDMLFSIVDKVDKEMVLEVDDLSSRARKWRRLPIYVKDTCDFSLLNIDAISVDLLFNPTLLYFVDYDAEKISKNVSKITLNNINIHSIEDDILVMLNVITALGNAESCDLTLANPKLHGGNANVQLNHGKFTLEGICHEGGTRLFDGGKINFGIHSVSPNPASDWMKIEFGVIEKGTTKLELYDIVGKKIKILLEENIEEEGIRTVNTDISQFGQGQYILILKSGSMIEQKTVFLVR